LHQNDKKKERNEGRIWDREEGRREGKKERRENHKRNEGNKKEAKKKGGRQRRRRTKKESTRERKNVKIIKRIKKEGNVCCWVETYIRLRHRPTSYSWVKNLELLVERAR
jgi:hypothetical protein